MKRLSLLFVLVAALFFLLGGSALAVFGPHGGYTADTSFCAGCHRAHTAVSPLTWVDTAGGIKNALLINTATTIQAFCYTCHSAAGSGAATNVQQGVYDNSVARVGSTFDFPTSSTVGATLNAGGIDSLSVGTLGTGITSRSTTSTHITLGPGGLGGTQPMATAWGWDGSLAAAPPGTTAEKGGLGMVINCESCHDVHGSSNYRILRDTVNGVTVGGYLGTGFDPTPDPWVISNEVGYPSGVGGLDLGFRLHKDYSSDATYMYRPDYTTARYAQPVGLDVTKGISGWCAACHQAYLTISSSGQGAFDANDGYGNVTRHRHPVNQPLSTFLGVRPLLLGTTDTNTPWGDTVDIPLEHSPSTEGQGTSQTQALTDYLGCLTCHRAHGTSTAMIGFANATLAGTPLSPQILGPAGTTLAAAATAGDTTISVGHTVGFADGDTIIINPGGGVGGYPGTEETRTIAVGGVDPVNNTITVTVPLDADHSQYEIVKKPAPSTTVSVDASAGGTSFTVADATGMEVGQILQLDLNEAEEELVKIGAIADNVITLETSYHDRNGDGTNDGLRYAHIAGASVDVLEGVPPAGDSALLRANNRGVCERCHNK